MTDTRKKKAYSLAGKILLALFLLGMIILFIAFRIRKYREEEKIPVLSLDGRPVYADEVMVYFPFMQRAFEEAGGEDIWTLDMLGIDPQQAMIDRILDSVVRVKAASMAAQPLTEEDRETVSKTADSIKAFLPADYQSRYEISDETIYQVASDNLLSYRYTHNAHFIYDEIEDDIQSGLAERFGKYESTRAMNEYLDRVVLEPIMFYTGTFVEDEWTDYPAVQKQQIYERAQTIRESLTGKNFRMMANSFGDNLGDHMVLSNPVFHQGFVFCQEEQYGQLYRGQIEDNLAGELFSLPIGTISPVLTTPYGYLIVRISGFREASDQDRSYYEEELVKARSQYRQELTENLKLRRLEDELERLIENMEIVYYEDQLTEYLRTHQ
ncbi:MAG: hypothetical protein J6P72_05770 [Firmicutes bacterium]|nr:hypothetical protein [Bacillota bacterium]